MSHIAANQPKDQQKFLEECYEKGYQFEKYVKQLFNEHSFELYKWRKSQRNPQDLFSSDYYNPDLELYFKGSRKHWFAVECKWRQEFVNGRITWAKQSQISAYLRFQGSSRIPVFVAIGIGGEPSNPDKLFVTPLNNIWMNTDVFESELIPFKRRPQSRFFYDTVQLMLF